MVLLDSASLSLDGVHVTKLGGSRATVDGIRPNLTYSPLPSAGLRGGERTGMAPQDGVVIDLPLVLGLSLRDMKTSPDVHGDQTSLMWLPSRAMFRVATRSFRYLHNVVRA